MRTYVDTASRPIGTVILVASGFRLTPALTEPRVGAAPDDFDSVGLGETVESGDGYSTTVSQYEEDARYSAETVVSLNAGMINVWFAKICAANTDFNNLVSKICFTAVRAPVWVSMDGSGFVAPGIREPRLKDTYVRSSLVAGSCAEGWVAGGATDRPTVFPDASAISEELKVKFAWALE